MKQEKSMVGRTFSSEGKDLGDKTFFARDLGYDEEEPKLLDALEKKHAEELAHLKTR